MSRASLELDTIEIIDGNLGNRVTGTHCHSPASSCKSLNSWKKITKKWDKWDKKTPMSLAGYIL
jgi:hypothetical protein